MLDVKALLAKMLEKLSTTETKALSWNSGTAGSGLIATKWGNIVTLYIANPTKLATGSNLVATLPVGWRPINDASLSLIQPVGSISAGGTNLSLRATIRTNGRIEIYNYRSSAISGNTNQTGTVSFVVGGVVRRLLSLLASERRWATC